MFLKGTQYAEKSEPQGYFYLLYKAQQMPDANLMMNFSSDSIVLPKPSKIERCSDFLEKKQSLFFSLKWKEQGPRAGHHKFSRINQSPKMTRVGEEPAMQKSHSQEGIVWAAQGFGLFWRLPWWSSVNPGRYLSLSASSLARAADGRSQRLSQRRDVGPSL